ncbi:Radical SAM family enzyme, similar to coproporphyrinogen III oxidase, oxygen-independent, clustered with nucleoside-triphosphatase RdgB [hydrothermal vent metagenome]|uniref:Radical SAM family enzyme, similar to coproporphyrinogen III oxidase, oxygen-independent, clustered with nucleoside-triphosphatase RdgB n=1 Tax=hydrothermal vent metagenome TaxID=652676 RepID=A0A3B0WIK4_9ZZZZ
MKNNLPLSLYIHIPWCVKKCPYCDFNSHEKNQDFDEDVYVKALLLDLDDEYKNIQPRNLTSIFFGGGTPSLFSAEAIQKIIHHAKKLFKFNDIEITLEANPGTFEQEKFNGFYGAGINRLSIGVQSFNDAHLKTLGRIHDKQQALTAIETAKNAGFDNINLDLMFGLPQQTIQQAIDDVNTACEFNLPHISHYQLTIEENTYFHKHTPILPVSDLLWEMQTQCQKLLAKKNYKQYEISAYSKTNKQCAHNLNYWNFGDYIGIGAGAHGKITNENSATKKIEIIRRWKYRQPKQYIQQALKNKATSGQQVLKKKDIIFEFLLNTLRLKKGSDIITFEKNTGLNYQDLKQATESIDSDLLICSKNKITTTDKGFLFLNDVLAKLI